jgi:glucose-1-phosphate adenylyltransferase
MVAPRVLCLVLAGGRGSRLGPLTTGRAKPSLPVGGHYRLIDVALSNAAHSGLADVWVLQQYEPHLLNEHLSGGRPWDLDRSRGGFRTLPPFEGHDRDGFASGNADALARNWPVIAAFDPDVLLVCSADHLIKIDYREVIGVHLDSGADATVVSTTLPPGTDVSRYLVVGADRGEVRTVDYKPADDKSARSNGRYVGTEVFAYRPAALRDQLRELQRQGGDLGDYGERLLPALVAGGRVAGFDHRGHWRDLGTPEAYLDGQLELLRDRPPLTLDDPDWPILTSMPVRAPARIMRTAELDRAWLSPGADVAGTVVNSVIGPGVRIEPGAEVRHSVIMGDAVVRAGATVSRSVLAEHATVGRRATVGAPNATRPVLVGAKRRVADGATLHAGDHLEPTRPRDLFASTR